MDQCKHLCLVVSIMIGDLQTSAECQLYAQDPEYIISNQYNKMQGRSVNSPPFCLAALGTSPQHPGAPPSSWRAEPTAGCSTPSWQQGKIQFEDLLGAFGARPRSDSGQKGVAKESSGAEGPRKKINGLGEQLN